MREVWDTPRINITTDTCGTSLSHRISPGGSTQTARPEGTVLIQDLCMFMMGTGSMEILGFNRSNAS